MLKLEVEHKIRRGVNEIKKFYGCKLHSIWLAGSCGRDYPNLNGIYGDVDLYAVTWNRRPKGLGFDLENMIDYATMWVVTLYRIKNLLKRNMYHWMAKNFIKDAKCLWRCRILRWAYW